MTASVVDRVGITPLAPRSLCMIPYRHPRQQEPSRASPWASVCRPSKCAIWRLEGVLGWKPGRAGKRRFRCPPAWGFVVWVPWTGPKARRGRSDGLGPSAAVPP